MLLLSHSSPTVKESSSSSDKETWPEQISKGYGDLRRNISKKFEAWFLANPKTAEFIGWIPVARWILPPGKPMPPTMLGRFMVTFVPVAIGLAAAFAPMRLWSSFKCFLALTGIAYDLSPLSPNQTYEVDILSLLFWVLTIGFVDALFVRLRSEEAAEAQAATTRRDEHDETLGAILHMPGRRVLDHYSQWYGIVQETISLGMSQSSKGSLDEKQKARASALVLSMGIIANVARSFARRRYGMRYGASIMLYRPPGSRSKDASAIEALRFKSNGYNPDDGGGLLTLRSDLSVFRILDNSSDPAPRDSGEFPIISLPVPFPPTKIQETTKAISVGYSSAHSGKPVVTPEIDQALPGAPFALLHPLGFSVHDDTRTLADDYPAFEARVRDELAAYFREGGEGAGIRSIASFRIGKQDDPLGVLNIDTDQVGVVGTHERYYYAFAALIQPFISTLEPLVRAYRDAYEATLTKPPARKK